MMLLGNRCNQQIIPPWGPHSPALPSSADSQAPTSVALVLRTNTAGEPRLLS